MTRASGELGTADEARTSPISLGRFIGIIGLLAIAVVLLGTGAFALAERRRLLSDGQTRAEATAAFLADHAGRLFEVADLAMQSAAAQLGPRNWDAIGRDEELHARLRIIADTLPYIEDIWLNDAQGFLRLTSNAFPTPASNAADRLTFRQVAQPGSGFVVGDLIVGRVTHRPTFLVGRRLETADKSFRGMVSATADLAYFTDYWRRLDVPYATHVGLLRTGAPEAIVTATAHETPLPPESRTWDVIGEHAVGAFPLVVRVAFARESILATWRARIDPILPIVAAALLGLGSLTFLAFRQARRAAAAALEIERARNVLASANTRLEAAVSERTAELARATDDVQRFAHLMSHDLRAPLVNVLGFTGELETLTREIVDPAVATDDTRRTALAADIAEAIGFIRAGTTKMDRLLGHILRLSREGRRPMHVEPVDMTALLRGLADTIRFQADAAQATIEIGELPSLETDRLAMEQVFGNLLDNAIKYLEPGRPGRVVVAGTISATSVAIAVRDNGRGVAEADRERVFELFRRAGAETTPGEGIGLAYVRMLLQALGGRIELQSDRGEGSIFTVTLPRRPRQTAAFSSDTSR